MSLRTVSREQAARLVGRLSLAQATYSASVAFGAKSLTRAARSASASQTYGVTATSCRSAPTGRGRARALDSFGWNRRGLRHHCWPHPSNQRATFLGRRARLGDDCRHEFPLCHKDRAHPERRWRSRVRRQAAQGHGALELQTYHRQSSEAGRDLYTNEAIAGLVPRDGRVLPGILVSPTAALDLRSFMQPAAKGKTLNKKIQARSGYRCHLVGSKWCSYRAMNAREAKALRLREQAKDIIKDGHNLADQLLAR